MSLWTDPISAGIGLIKDALDRFGPADKTKKMELQNGLDELNATIHEKNVQDEFNVQLAGLQVVKAEAEGESWLQRTWRPIVALTFAGLVVAYWFGWSAPNLSADAVTNLFSLVKLCLGGYVIGRSGEKIVRTAAPQLQLFKKK